MSEKLITIMQFRKSPGDFIHRVDHHGETFIITKQGKRVAQLGPCELIVIDGKGNGIPPYMQTTRTGEKGE